MFRSGLDGMLIELGKWGLGMRDVVSNINFFSKVTASSSGKLTFHPGNSKAGDYVNLSFEMDTLMVLSAAPHPLDPAQTYQPGAVRLTAFATPPSMVARSARTFRERAWTAEYPAFIWLSWRCSMSDESY